MTVDEFKAQHLVGCRLDPDHPGACLLGRPFRIRPEGGREYIAPTTKNALVDGGNRREGKSTNPTHSKSKEEDMTTIPETTDNLNLPPLDTPEQIGAEIVWCAREGHELLGSDDEARRREAHRVRKERLVRAVQQSEERVEQAIAHGEEPVFLSPVAPQPAEDDRGWCPSWCTKHRAYADGTALIVAHSTQVNVGETCVSVDLETHADGTADPDGTVVWVPELDWVNGQELDNLITALQQARDLVMKEAMVQRIADTIDEVFYGFMLTHAIRIANNSKSVPADPYALADKALQLLEPTMRQSSSPGAVREDLAVEFRRRLDAALGLDEEA